MACNCNCNNTHKVTEVAVSETAVALTVSNSTDIGNLEKFNLLMNKTVSGITANPVPVTITVNNVSVPLKNRFGQQIQSNKIPFGFSAAYYVADELAETPAPYVIILTTPPIPRYA